MTSKAPGYDSGWATEIALDVQWAHAIAPLARIVLIEAPDATLNSLLGGIKLANAMGPGVVSMSFGANEGNYTASVDAAFTGAGMTYLAATGDSGAAVSWPAVSPNVVAVSGTSLSYSGSGPRSEVTWSGTGGAVSAYTAKPAYQSAAVPGMGTPLRRSVADVAFNADPNTGQYVAVQSSSGSLNWISAGGTSLSTPQWAGLLAVANAQRALAGKPVLGSAHTALYSGIASVPGNYAAAFADINRGANGSCSTCAAKIGYDTATGLGTPHSASLLSLLGGSSASPAATAPVVTPASISGKVGSALSFTASASGPNPLSFSLSGAPAGLLISASSGVVSWPSPVAGNYALTVVARDSKTGLSGQAVYSISIAAAPTAAAPKIMAATLTGKAGVPLSYSLMTQSVNPLSYSLSGAPQRHERERPGRVELGQAGAGQLQRDGDGQRQQNRPERAGRDQPEDRCRRPADHRGSLERRGWQGAHRQHQRVGTGCHGLVDLHLGRSLGHDVLGQGFYRHPQLGPSRRQAAMR